MSKRAKPEQLSPIEAHFNAYPNDTFNPAVALNGDLHERLMLGDGEISGLRCVWDAKGRRLVSEDRETVSPWMLIDLTFGFPGAREIALLHKSTLSAREQKGWGDLLLRNYVVRPEAASRPAPAWKSNYERMLRCREVVIAELRASGLTDEEIDGDRDRLHQLEAVKVREAIAAEAANAAEEIKREAAPRPAQLGSTNSHASHAPRKRGRSPEKETRVAAEIVSALKNGKDLGTFEAMAKDSGVSISTARRAFITVKADRPELFKN